MKLIDKKNMFERINNTKIRVERVDFKLRSKN